MRICSYSPLCWDCQNSIDIIQIRGKFFKDMPILNIND